MTSGNSIIILLTSDELSKVTNAIIMPFIDMAVSADYLNQMTCWWFEDLCSDIGNDR